MLDQELKEHELSPLAFKSKMGNAVILDVRTFEEFKVDRIGKPLLIDYYKLNFKKSY